MADEARLAEPILGNKQIEDAAIAFVIDYESRKGRKAHDARYRGAAADVESDGRVIEVKAVARSARTAGFLMLETRQIAEAKRNPNFFLYLVEGVAQGDPERFELRIVGGEALQRLIGRGKERRYFEVPLPAAEYDAITAECTNCFSSKLQACLTDADRQQATRGTMSNVDERSRRAGRRLQWSRRCRQPHLDLPRPHARGAAPGHVLPFGGRAARVLEGA